MINRIQEKRGRKPLPIAKKIVSITIYVLGAHQGVARAECAKIQAKYR